MSVRVAVVGAGAAGLCAVRHLSARPETFKAVCFEKNHRPGGTWFYTEETGVDKNGLPVHSSMYKNLRTNIPKEVMAFPDFPFKKDLPSFIKHTDVHEYLESYADYYDLSKHIKFSTVLQRMVPLKNKGETKWQLTYSDVENQNLKLTETFDAVMMCMGHYSVPLMPSIPGIDTFKGHIMHSHDYRHPDQYTGKRVVCLGAAASGQDISVDISSKAKVVYLSHNKERLESVLPGNVIQKSGIKQINENSVVFKDGEEQKVDAILFCTGYQFSFPFLTEECQVRVDDERITPLYKHLIHTVHPTLSIIGILKTICPFPNFHNQVRFVLATLDGSLQLPSKEEMDRQTEDEYKSRMAMGMPQRYAHFMGPMQWQYNDDLAKLASFEPIPKAVELLYDEVHRTRVKDITGYKSLNYELTDKDRYTTRNTNSPSNDSRQSPMRVYLPQQEYRPQQELILLQEYPSCQGNLANQEYRQSQVRNNNPVTQVLVCPVPDTKTEPTPTDQVCCAVFVCLCCFWPTGIFAILKANQAQNYHARGDYNRARTNRATANRLIGVSAALGLVIIVAVVAIRYSSFRDHTNY